MKAYPAVNRSHSQPVSLTGFFVIWLLLGSALTADATTYYVATTGDDGRSCSEAQQITAPKRTIAQGLACLASGDTVLIRGGTYDDEYIASDMNNWRGIPSGTSWTNLTTISGYPGETVILKATTEASRGATIALGTDESYISFEQLVLDGNGKGGGINLDKYTGFPSFPHHLRFKGIEIKYVPSSGILGIADDTEYLNLHVHHWGLHDTFECGGGCDHGIYYGGDNTLVEGGEWHDGTGFGIHLRAPNYSHNNAVVRSNRIYNNGGSGIIFVGGVGHCVENNLIYNNKGGGMWGAPKARNNTFVNNDVFTPFAGEPMDVRNNILYNSKIDNPSPALVTAFNNLCTAPGLGCALIGDPQFVNASAADFRLTATSPAIDAGVSLSDVLTDFDGVSRPQGSGFDIGAYEYRPSSPLAGDLNGDGKRDLADVRLLIYMLIGQQPTTPEADLTGDGAVTLADVQALIKLMVGLP